MTEVYASTIVPAPIDEVWDVVGDYGGIAKWHPAVNDTQIKEGPAADQVGSIRQCELDGGAKLVERQTARSDDERFYSYIITDSPMPMTNCEGTIRLRPVTDGGATFMEWISRFDPAPGAEGELSIMMADIYQAGFESLKARFGGG